MRYATRYGALLLAVVTLAALTMLPGAVPPARAAGVTYGKEITRQHVNADGTQGSVQSKNFQVTIEQTEDLQPRQRIEISWSGAEPSRGYGVSIPPAEGFDSMEYPVAVMQCRGVDAGQRAIDPRTCFTTVPASRYTMAFWLGGDEYYEGASWILDRYAPAADRDPSPAVPSGCFDETAWAAVHYLPFIDAKGKSWPMCPSLSESPTAPPEASGGQTALPPNDQFMFSDADGRGRTYFEVRSKAENASLGCSDTVACSLVIVPVMGISCHLASTSSPYMRDECASTGKALAGPRGGTVPELAASVTGRYWWSASNWRNRVSVPLTFAPRADICDVLDHRAPVDLYGSELMGEAMLQWTPAFCLDPKRFKLRHQRVGEPRAKRQLESGQAVGALVSRPAAGDPAKPTVYAPAAISGFAIGYVWDKKRDPVTGISTGELTNLKLTPRLLAKLVTQSYPSFYGMGRHPTVGDNPPSLGEDPEFQALNPDANVFFASEASAALISISADSDVIAEVTRYIDADPAARAWLDGAPDEWGMRVNPKFRGLALPLETQPLLDDWALPEALGPNITCQDTTTPYLNQLANPPASLAQTSTSVLEARPSAVRKCDIDTVNNRYQLKQLDRQPVGTRNLVALVSLADLDKYKLRAAALQTRPGAFVTPDVGSMRTAMRFTTVDKKTGTLNLDHALMRSNEAGKYAYPGTMPIYTSAHTAGLKQADAAHVADFMRFSVTDGQVAGEGNGKLPQGYLPITSESGLGSLVDRTLALADAVEKQTGEEPPPPDDLGPDDKIPPASGPGSNSGSNNRSIGNGPGGSQVPVPGSTPNVPPTTGPSVSPSPSPSPDGNGRKAAEQALTSTATRGESSWLARWALPLLLMLGLLGGVGAPVVVAAARPGHPVRRGLAGSWAMLRRLRLRLRLPRRD